MTNGDRVRALPDEVLAEILWSCCFGAGCKRCPIEKFCGGLRFFSSDDWLGWIKSEAEEDADNV